MSEEKPLNVRVAEALGCKPRLKAGRFVNRYFCDDGEHTPQDGLDFTEVYEYETDWNATGPLIERLGVTLEYLPCTKHEGCDKLKWDARVGEDGPTEAGDTPLRAVCDLILALKAAGKLGVRAGSGVEGTKADE